MQEIRKYHLHKDDYSKLHFEVNDAFPYCQRNVEHCHKAHQHSFYQLIWFEQEGQHFVDYETITHPANTLFFLNKKQVHYFCPQSKNEGTLYHFDEIFLNQEDNNGDDWLQYKIFNEVGKPYVFLSEEETLEFKYFTNLINRELREKPNNYRKQVFHLFQILLLKVERLKRVQQNVEESLDNKFLLAMDFKRLIENHINEFLSVEKYSQLLGISNKNLTALSKKYLKDTPANIIHQRKILEAKRLLSNLKVSIKEVAYSLGFDQPTYFTKYFKKHTGITPKEFIKQLP